jgi:DNA-binding CsgD family transcriptional regulator
VLLLDEAGRVRSATAAAARLLDLAAVPDELPSTLRAISARSASAGEDQVVLGVSMRGGGSLMLVGARAGASVTVVVERLVSRDHAAGLGRFTRRERDVLELITQGLPTKRIATLLDISPWTVTAHLQAIFTKAGVTSRNELMALVLARAAG